MTRRSCRSSSWREALRYIRGATRVCWIAVLLAMLALLESSASASSPGTGSEAPLVVVDLDEPLRLDGSMRRWLRWNVADRSRLGETEEQRLARLDRALNSPEFELSEVTEGSGNAREVFARREADCVGYAFLFAAFARELGIELEFVVEEKVDSIEERPGVRILRRHLAVAHRSSGSVYDRAGPQPMRRSDHEVIALAVAVAILESNLGAQALLEGELDAATDHFRRAVRVDPDLAFAWRNLAVSLRRAGEDVGAASAWARAREIDAREGD